MMGTVTALPVRADCAPHPGDVRLDHRGVGVAGSEHYHLSFERHADGDVSVGAVDRTQNRPDVVFVGHLDDLVLCSPPQAVVIRDCKLMWVVRFEVTSGGDSGGIASLAF